MEHDKRLPNAIGLRLVHPLLKLGHLLGIFWPITVPQRRRTVIVLATPEIDEAGALEVEFVDEVLRRDAEFFQIRHSRKNALNLWVSPHFVVTHAHEKAPIETGCAHLVVWRGQLLKHRVVHALPVWTVVDGEALIAPPDRIAAIDDKFGTPRLDILHDFTGHPFAALKPEHRPMHARKQFHVFNGCLSDPTFIYRQGHHFRLGCERHDYLDQVLCDRIEDHLHILRYDGLGDLFRHDQPEHLHEELAEVRLSLFQR